ncbi:MAG: ABC transporter permease subunit [Bacilli bacterium]|nr:ABC transporter permease subunit [Bacilli bacterium]
MNKVFITCRKELRAIFRDKKFVSIIFLMPLIIPFFIIGMGFLYENIDSTEGYKIGVNYEISEEEKTIFNNIAKDTEFVYKSNDELKTLYDEGEIDAYILKNESYDLYVDTSATKGLTISSLVGGYFEALNTEYAKGFLIEKGYDPDSVLNVIHYELKDQAKEGTSFFTNFLISFSLVYLVMIITVTAMNTSTDIIAGEKERGTFETLLTFPITSNEIIGGKLMAIVCSCIISAVIGIATSIPAFAIVKNNTEMFKTMHLNTSFVNILLALVVVIIVSCLVGVISIFLCGKAKTFKEAQSKVSALSFMSMIPMFTSLMEVSSDVLYMIPIANAGTILNDLFVGEMKMHNMLIFVVSSILVTVIVTIYVSKQYKDEKALF